MEGEGQRCPEAEQIQNDWWFEARAGTGLLDGGSADRLLILGTSKNNNDFKHNQGLTSNVSSTREDASR